MIFVCIPAREETQTAGLLLWKVRKVFEAFGREYQLLVALPGRSPGSDQVLAPYTNVLPLTLVETGQGGYPEAVDALLALALERSDRPRRDCAILMQADFTHGPEFIPDLVRQVDSGADLVVAQGQVTGPAPAGLRLLRRWGAFLLRGPVGIPGVRDAVSGFLAVRLSCLRLAVRERRGGLLTTDGWAANAELMARLGARARRVETVPVTERHDLRPPATEWRPWPFARSLWEARDRVRAAARPAT